MRTIEISGTKDGGFLVERRFAGITSERFIVAASRECPRFKGGFDRQPEWVKEAIAHVQAEKKCDPIFFHVEGSIYDAGEATLLGMLPLLVEPMGWYYWDETWANYHGPFESYDAAHKNLVAYCAWLNAPKTELINCKCALPSEALEPELDHPLHSTLDVRGYTEKEQQ